MEESGPAVSGVEPLWERFIAWDNLILAAAEALEFWRAWWEKETK